MKSGLFLIFVATAILLTLSADAAVRRPRCPVTQCRRDAIPFCGIRADGSTRDIEGTCIRDRYKCGELDEVFASIVDGPCSKRNPPGLRAIVKGW